MKLYFFPEGQLTKRGGELVWNVIEKKLPVINTQVAGWSIF